MRTAKGDELGRVLADMTRRIENLEKGSRARQLPDSSIDDGNLHLRDADGAVRGTFGRHTDGTYALTYTNGPAPPAPSAPTLVAAELSLVVASDGRDADGNPFPADVERVDIHESETDGFVPDGSTVRSSLPPAGGARLLVLDNQTHYVKLVAVTTSGAASAPSAAAAGRPLPVSAFAAGSITGADIAANTITGDNIGAGSLRSQALALNNAASGQLLTYPGFEDGVDGAAVVGDWARDDAVSRTGNWSLRVNLPGGVAAEWKLLDSYAVLDSWSTMTASGWLKSTLTEADLNYPNATVLFRYRFRYYDSSDTLILTDDVTLSEIPMKESPWQLGSATSQCPRAAVSVDVSLWTNNIITDGPYSVWFDDCSIVANTVNVRFNESGMVIDSNYDIEADGLGAFTIGNPQAGDLQFDPNMIRKTHPAGAGFDTLHLNPGRGINLGGRDINGVYFGFVNKPTDTSGQITIDHGLGRKPAIALPIVDAGSPATIAKPMVTSFNDTSFTVQCVNMNGNPLGGGNNTGIFWTVVA